MKTMKSKIALTFILAVCSLTGCREVDTVYQNDAKNDASAAVLTTDSVSPESTATTASVSADQTEDIQTAQTETTLPDQTEAVQTTQNETAQPDATEVTPVEQSENKSDTITEQQALDAIKNYCFIQNPDLKNMVDSGEYDIYWNVTANDADEIVVLYKSYTAAQMRYYINPVSGETYVTELVPGIIDEEQRTEESFNVRNYLA